MSEDPEVICLDEDSDTLNYVDKVKRKVAEKRKDNFDNQSKDSDDTNELLESFEKDLTELVNKYKIIKNSNYNLYLHIELIRKKNEVKKEEKKIPSDEEIKKLLSTGLLDESDFLGNNLLEPKIEKPYSSIDELLNDNTNIDIKEQSSPPINPPQQVQKEPTKFANFLRNRSKRNSLHQDNTKVNTTSKNIFNESSNIESTTYDQIFQSKIKKHQSQFQSILSQKKQRDKMPKYKCEICSKFYDAIGETEPICLDCSRHRTNLKVQNTPEDFYSLDI